MSTDWLGVAEPKGLPDWHLLSPALAYLTNGFWEQRQQLFAIAVVVFVCRSYLATGLRLRTQAYFVLRDRSLLWACVLAWCCLNRSFILSCRRTMNWICDHQYLPSQHSSAGRKQTLGRTGASPRIAKRKSPCQGS